MKDAVQDRFIVAVAVEGTDDRAFFVHRNPAVTKEYRGFWSLPTIEITSADYAEAVNCRSLPTATMDQLTRKRLGGTPLCGGRLLVAGARRRTSYSLKMAIFTATSLRPLYPNGDKYDKWAYMTPAEMLKASGRRCGTCCSLYLQGLVNSGRIASTCSYLELPPELADSERALEGYSPEELWRLAASNYPLLVRGETGGEGHILRSLILDRFLDSFLDSQVTPATRVLDAGCGEGGVLERIASRTKLAAGLELVDRLLVRATVAEKVVRGDLYDTPRLFGKSQFDLVILNLVVLWLADLDGAAESISEILSQNGCVLVTTTPPEFTKNGDWIIGGGDLSWVVDQPLRRERMLTMINRCVGPLWLYPRCTADILSSFGSKGLHCTGARQLYLDSYLGDEELSQVLNQNPAFRRHQMLPAFTAITFKKASSH